VRRPSDLVRHTPDIGKTIIRMALCVQFALWGSLSALPDPGIPPGPAQVPRGLGPLVRKYPPAVESSLTALKQGVDSFRKGQFEEALRDLPEEDSAAATLIGDYALCYRAKSSLALDRGEDALRQFRLLQNRYPASPLIQESILGECHALLKLHQSTAALALLQDRKIEESAETLVARAQALEEAGRNNEAFALYLRVYAKYTTSGTASLAEQRLISISPAFEVSPKNYSTMLERSDNLLRAGRSRDARALLLKLAQVKAPPGASAEKRKVLWAQAEYNLGRSAGLIPLLEKIGAADPAVHAQAIYLLGLCYRRMQKEESFLAMRNRALSLYPLSPFTEKLLFSAAAYFDLANRLEEGGEAFAQVAKMFRKGEYGERSLWRASLFLYFQKRYEEALRGFWQYRAAFSSLSASVAALYWMGRCYEKLGDGARAAYLYGRCRSLANDHYYGQRARESALSLAQPGIAPGRPSNGIDFALVQKWADGLQIPDAAIPEPSPSVEAILERVRQLAAAGLPDSALAELRSALRRYPDDHAIQYVMSLVYEQKEDFPGVIRTLRRAFPDYDFRPVTSLPREIWDLLFPMRYQREIDKEAVRHRLDPNLVRAVIRQESAFVEEARSAANARGLMQVLPSTGRKLARDAGIDRYTVQKLYRADVNIALGTRFLAGLLTEYDQRVEVALVAYNAGGDRAERWTQEFGITNMAEFVDRIPFTETRDYVKQVLTNAAYYRQLAAAPGAENH
jgi:soluble lytic murein transglycosylase